MYCQNVRHIYVHFTLFEFLKMRLILRVVYQDTGGDDRKSALHFLNILTRHEGVEWHLN